MRSIFGCINHQTCSLSSGSIWEKEGENIFFVSNNKFEDDKVVYQSDEYLLLLDGVIFNKKELLLNSTVNKTWTSYFFESWMKDSKKAIQNLRGEFSGLFYNKKNKRLELFNNPTGTKQFYYYHKNDVFAFASSAIDLVTLLKSIGETVEINPNACYSFMGYGALLNNQSWVKYSTKLEVGSMLYLENNTIETSNYKRFSIQQDYSKTKSELLKEFDQLMVQAVRREWSKDKEYGYKMFSTLSGGLDSRVNVMLARELGFVDQVNFCCSKKDYADETISRKMAKDFGHHYHFYALDGLEHFYKPEYILEKLGGHSSYLGPAHLRVGIDEFWNKNYGIIHSGQMGDGFLGGFLSDKITKEPNVGFGRESYEAFPKNIAFDNALQEKYSSEEAFKIYERGFGIANSGFWVLEDLSYYSSPFMDVDVLDFLAKLPYQYKYKRTFYLEWMIKFHPEMTKYKWEYVHSKPNAVWKTKYATTFMRLKYGWLKLLSPKFRQGFDMTPEQFWFEGSSKLRNFYENEIEKQLAYPNIKDVPYFQEIKQFALSNSVNKKSKALTLLIILNKILNNGD
ncbi:MAG: hypothetical protein ACPG6V_08670 [Flavobacteriales bacterium]